MDGLFPKWKTWEKTQRAFLLLWFPLRGHADWQEQFVRHWDESPKALFSCYSILLDPRGGGKIFLSYATGSQAGLGFLPAHFCSEEAPRNCTCQTCQELKAKGDGFDSFQQPFLLITHVTIALYAWRIKGVSYELCVSKLTPKILGYIFVALQWGWQCRLCLLLSPLFEEKTGLER